MNDRVRIWTVEKLCASQSDKKEINLLSGVWGLTGLQDGIGAVRKEIAPGMCLAEIVEYPPCSPLAGLITPAGRNVGKAHLPLLSFISLLSLSACL